MLRASPQDLLKAQRVRRGVHPDARLIRQPHRDVVSIFQYAQLFQPPLLDAWRCCNKSEKHPPTTGLHDRAQWPMGGHCRDYFALTSDVAARIASIEMDAATDASDHQPLRLALRG